MGVILQYAQMALSTASSLFYTPVMLRILGQGEYGLYNLASSIISYLSLLSLGFSASYIRFYSRYKSNDDEVGIRKLNGTYFLTFLFLAVIAFVGGIILAFHIDEFFTVGYTQEDLKIAKILMFFMAFNLAWSFPVSVFTSYITSQEKFVFQKVVGLGRTVISPMMTLPVLLMGYGSIGMVIVTTVMSLITDTIYIIYCLKFLKMRFSFRNASISLLKEVAVFSMVIAINQIVDQINWNIDKIILAKIVGKESVAVYAVSSTINTMYISFSSCVSSVFVPQIHRIVAVAPSDRDEQLTAVFIKVGRIQYAILALILTGFVFFGQYFISIWAGEGYELAYYVVLLLITFVTVPLIQNIGIEIQRAKNKHYFRMYTYATMAVINVFLSIALCKRYGIIGTTIGTSLSLLIANGLIMNAYYYKALGINVVKFWKQIIRMSAGIIPAFLLGICIMKFVTVESKLNFFAWILCYCIVYAISMWFIGFNSYEKSLIVTPIRKLFRKGEGA